MKFELLNPEVCPGTEVDLKQIDDIIIGMKKDGIVKITEDIIRSIAGELYMLGDISTERIGEIAQKEAYSTLGVYMSKKRITQLVLEGMCRRMNN